MFTLYWTILLHVILRFIRFLNEFHPCCFLLVSYCQMSYLCGDFGFLGLALETEFKAGSCQQMEKKSSLLLLSQSLICEGQKISSFVLFLMTGRLRNFAKSFFNKINAHIQIFVTSIGYSFPFCYCHSFFFQIDSCLLLMICVLPMKYYFFFSVRYFIQSLYISHYI